MQNNARNREQPDPRSFAARKGHFTQLSISDDNHHVTEAIGHMYGDEDSPSSPRSSGRYSGRSEKSMEGDLAVNGRRNSLPRKPIAEHKLVNGDRMASLNTQTRSPINYRSPWESKNGGSPVSPLSARERSPSDTANTQFPLNDIDYESSPAAVAQELSNLQALRRMSMDVGAAGDPDLPQLNTAAIPSAPSPTTSEDDSARLFWVPARLHPELAPKEFKSFLESKAEQIKRRSGELSAFSSPVSSRPSSLSVSESSGSSANLRRRKSILSRTIESPAGYQDGADIIEFKKTQEQHGQPSDPNLEELENLVSVGSGLSRLSFDSKDGEETGDVILPSIPGSSLKRSTRTKYQRPDSRKGPVDRSTFAERAKRRAATGMVSGESIPPVPTIEFGSNDNSLPDFSTNVTNLASTLRNPYVEPSKPPMNFSRPGTITPSPPPKDPVVPVSTATDSLFCSREDGDQVQSENVQKLSRRAATAPVVGQMSERPIPQIIESPPTDDHPVRTSSITPRSSNTYSIKSEAPKPSEPTTPRERSKAPAAQRPSMPPKNSTTNLSNQRPSSRGSNMPPQTPPIQTLEQPSPLPGHDNNTSNLSFIPTLNVDKKQEQRKKEEKKSGWGWLLGKEESDRKEEKSKTKSSKQSQAHDSTRLDVLQTSIDGGPKGRESLVLDRDNLKLEEERKKESLRKTSGEKKEKESIFSSIFGGKKHKAEKDAQRKAQERLSPEPPYRELKPDIDFNWTRFSILEERAIYRMAHIKLANPRRALYSQVLLSNFMYSYLAKVQQMHPQMNLPTSAKQQRKQKEQQQLQQLQHQQQQPDEFAQYQRYQQQQAQQNAPSQEQPTRQSLDGDSIMYDYNFSRDRNNKHSAESSSTLVGSDQYSGGTVGNSYVGGGGTSSHPQHPTHQRPKNSPGYNKYNEDDDDDDDDMW